MADSQITVKTTIVNPAHWQAADQSNPIPLQQHPGYGLALQSFGVTATHLHFMESETEVATALLVHRKIFGLFRVTTLFRGPLWHRANTPQSTKLACYKKLRSLYAPWRWNFLAILPEADNDSQTLAAFKAAGMRRIMSGFSTAWLDLRLYAIHRLSIVQGTCSECCYSV